MAELKTKPDIRFGEYTDAWEQRRLGEVVAIKSGWSPSNFIKGGFLFVKVDDLNYSDRVQNNSQMKVADNSRLAKMKKGSTIFPKRGAAIMTNKVRILAQDGYMDTNMMALEPNDEIDSDFLYTFIYETGLYKIADTSTIPQINNKHIEPYKLLLPMTEEQQIIGNFFRNLDETITLKKQQHEKTVNIKKAMLEKMFPKKGADVPEIRFEGFAKPWKQTPLSDIAEFNPKALVPNTFKYVDLESVVGTSMVSFRTEKKETSPSRAQRLARRGDIFFQMVRPYQRNNLLYDLPFDDFVFSTGYAQLRPKIDSYFLFSRLQEDRFVTEVLDYCTGTGYPAITSNNLAIIKIFISTDPKEQTAIGNFFRNLDNLIESQWKELEKLQNIKKACLNKMFV